MAIKNKFNPLLEEGIQKLNNAANEYFDASIGGATAEYPATSIANGIEQALADGKRVFRVLADFEQFGDWGAITEDIVFIADGSNKTITISILNTGDYDIQTKNVAFNNTLGADVFNATTRKNLAKYEIEIGEKGLYVDLYTAVMAGYSKFKAVGNVTCTTSIPAGYDISIEGVTSLGLYPTLTLSTNVVIGQMRSFTVINMNVVCAVTSNVIIFDVSNFASKYKLKNVNFDDNSTVTHTLFKGYQSSTVISNSEVNNIKFDLPNIGTTIITMRAYNSKGIILNGGGTSCICTFNYTIYQSNSFTSAIGNIKEIGTFSTSASTLNLFDSNSIPVPNMEFSNVYIPSFDIKSSNGTPVNSKFTNITAKKFYFGYNDYLTVVCNDNIFENCTFSDDFKLWLNALGSITFKHNLFIKCTLKNIIITKGISGDVTVEDNIVKDSYMTDFISSAVVGTVTHDNNKFSNVNFINSITNIYNNMLFDGCKFEADLINHGAWNTFNSPKVIGAFTVGALADKTNIISPRTTASIVDANSNANIIAPQLI